MLGCLLVLHGGPFAAAPAARLRARYRHTCAAPSLHLGPEEDTTTATHPMLLCPHVLTTWLLFCAGRCSHPGTPAPMVHHRRAHQLWWCCRDPTLHHTAHTVSIFGKLMVYVQLHVPGLLRHLLALHLSRSLAPLQAVLAAMLLDPASTTKHSTNNCCSKGLMCPRGRGLAYGGPAAALRRLQLPAAAPSLAVNERTEPRTSTIAAIKRNKTAERLNDGAIVMHRVLSSTCGDSCCPPKATDQD